jgi:predicted protein tyrosine phosphatase
MSGDRSNSSEGGKRKKLSDSPLQGVWDKLKKQPRQHVYKEQRSKTPPLNNNNTLSSSRQHNKKKTRSLERRRPKGLHLDMSLLGTTEEGFNKDDEELVTNSRASNEVAMVLPHLYISGASPAQDTSRLLELGITHIVNCCVHRAQSSDSSRFHVLDLKLNDSCSSDVVMYIYMTIDFVETARRSGGKVLIHCLKGISRSASLVISYLMWNKNISDVREALSVLQIARPSCNPNADFLVQLRHWARHRPSMSKNSTYLYRIASCRTRRGMVLPSIRGPISGRELFQVTKKTETRGDSNMTSKRRKMTKDASPSSNNSSTSSSSSSSSSSSHSASSYSSTTTLTEDLLLSRLECFMLLSPERLYVWYDIQDVRHHSKLHDNDCRMKLMHLVVSYFQRYESCTSQEIQFLEHGNETDLFWFDLRKAHSVDGVLTPRLLDMSMEGGGVYHRGFHSISTASTSSSSGVLMTSASTFSSVGSSGSFKD